MIGNGKGGELPPFFQMKWFMGEKKMLFNSLHNLIYRLVKIRDDILNVLNTNRNP